MECPDHGATEDDSARVKAVVSAMEERRSVPPNVDAALRKALEKLPADRFTSAQGFANALADEHFSGIAEVAGQELVGGASRADQQRERASAFIASAVSASKGLLGFSG